MASKRRRGEPEFADGLDNRGRPIIPGERRSNRTAAREASEEPDDQTSPSDRAVSEPEAAVTNSADDYGNGDDDDDGEAYEEPNGDIAVGSRSEAIEVD